MGWESGREGNWGREGEGGREGKSGREATFGREGGRREERVNVEGR